MSFFSDWYHSIDGCDVIKCYRRSQISQVADRRYRRSQLCMVADRNIARFSLCHFMLFVWHCDVRRRISAIDVSLGSLF